jgi:hypothetical protein
LLAEEAIKQELVVMSFAGLEAAVVAEAAKSVALQPHTLNAKLA